MFCLTRKLFAIYYICYSLHTLRGQKCFLWLVFLGLLLACWERLAPNDSGPSVVEGSNVVPSFPSSIFLYMFVRIKLKVEKLVIFL